MNFGKVKEAIKIMAIRPIFLTNNEKPFYKEQQVNFIWYSGFAISQKKKCVKSLHEEYKRINNNSSLLEISTKSEDEIGIRLSAFNLKFISKYYNKELPVELFFQGAKVFDGISDNTIVHTMTPSEAKKYIKELGTKKLKKFRFEGIDFPLEPKTLFYDWLYINALLQNKELINPVLKFTGFTDIEFNPNKSINCQARTIAIFKSLIDLNIIDKGKNNISFSEFQKILCDDNKEYIENISFFNSL